MEQLTLEIDSFELQCLPIEELSSSGRSSESNDDKEFQEMDKTAMHSVGRTRRGRAPMSPSDDDDFTPPASSTRIMSRPKSKNRGRTRSKSQQRQQSTINKPKKTRSRSRKSLTGRSGKASIKPAKSRSRSRSASKGRKPATRGRRGKM